MQLYVTQSRMKFLRPVCDACPHDLDPDRFEENREKKERSHLNTKSNAGQNMSNDGVLKYRVEQEGPLSSCTSIHRY